MWLLILLFGLATLVLGWTLFGYFLYLWFLGLFRRRPAVEWPERWPRISVVIPCRNEEGAILAKIENTAKLDYPADQLEVVFVDGGSTDQTLGILRRELEGRTGWRVLESPVSGKVGQLNHALSFLDGEIVVNTDVDALLAPDALRWLAAELASSPEVAVVGACSRPTDEAYHIDRYYWDEQNRGRFIECAAANLSIVVAPCYAFRRELLSRFPDDVVADDIYIAFHCRALGKKTIYSRHAKVTEVRNPRSLDEFLPHKFRKANAFLRESLRFVYRLPETDAHFRLMLATRIGQQLLFPWALIWWLLTTGSLLTLGTQSRWDVVVIGAAFLLVLFLFTSRAFRTVRLPDPRRHSLLTAIKGWILTTIILTSTGISYPFFRQNSEYRRVGEGAPEGAAPEGAEQERADP